MHPICILKNPIQEYAWGSLYALPELLGTPSPAQRPQAELWMGAHPRAPSLVFYNRQWIPLAQWIALDPASILGEAVRNRFAARLPFLFKVLAVEKPLSVQVHPNADQARKGFARENALGIRPDAPHRSYRDDNHKPEIICALTDFWALNGFRKIPDTLRLFEMLSVSDLMGPLADFRRQANAGGLKSFFTTLMCTERGRRDRIVMEAVDKAEKLASLDPVFEWMILLNLRCPTDIGVFSPLLLNLVHLRPGEAIFLPPGDIHSYLGGIGIELMANSDNVIRCGLTSKHIDIPELLDVVSFEEKEISILTPRAVPGGEKVYDSPGREFILSTVAVFKDQPFTSSSNRSVEVMICMEGRAVVTDFGTGASLEVGKGSSVVVPACVGQYCIKGEAALYKASVPLHPALHR